MRNAEHREQATLFRWAKLNEYKHPELALMFAVPNGGHRHLFVAKKLKAGKNRPTGTQKAWHKRLKENGHKVEVCYGWHEATEVILYYLGL